MTRRSARLASAPSKVPIGGPTVTVDDQRDFTEPDHEDCDEEILKPKKKRQKQSKKPSSTVGREFKNVRGRRGALKAIVEMPLDILHESRKPAAILFRYFEVDRAFIGCFRE
ncbi:hypothetical protein C0989_003957 [Termitomyces sp. Mn162]|nr:hypothetical protein C0989_003957 [Termitomyces sp. Mn162]